MTKYAAALKRLCCSVLLASAVSTPVMAGLIDVDGVLVELFPANEMDRVYGGSEFLTAPPRRRPPGRRPPPARRPPRRPPPRTYSYVCYAQNEYRETFQGRDRFSAALAQRDAMDACYAAYSRRCRALGCQRY